MLYYPLFFNIKHTPLPTPILKTKLVLKKALYRYHYCHHQQQHTKLCCTAFTGMLILCQIAYIIRTTQTLSIFSTIMHFWCQNLNVILIIFTFLVFAAILSSSFSSNKSLDELMLNVLRCQLTY